MHAQTVLCNTNGRLFFGKSRLVNVCDRVTSQAKVLKTKVAVAFVKKAAPDHLSLLVMLLL